ncbi:MAG: hypothetical protein ACREYC_16595 [Gammaproteobacteria bacterium]
MNILVNTQSGLDVFSTVAHEVMHASQAAHARPDCKVNWWKEATATWAEGFAYPKVVISGFRPFEMDEKTAKGSETGMNGVTITWNFKP